MEWKDIITLILGWGLGLLSPLILDKINKKSKSKELKECIFIELDELKILLAMLRFNLETKYNTLSMELIDSLIPIFENTKAINNTGKTLGVLKNFKNYSHEDFKKAVEHYKTPGSLSVKKLDLPFLKSKIQELDIFNIDLQRQLLDINYMLDLYNRQVEECKFYYKMTFDGNISDQNHSIVTESLKQIYLQISDRVKILIDRIESVRNNK